MDVEVTDRTNPARFEARIGEALAGTLYYVREPGRLVFTHTEVGQEYEGRGVGSALAREGLATARAAGLAVVPQCPFIASYIQRHPGEYDDLVSQ